MRQEIQAIIDPLFRDVEPTEEAWSLRDRLTIKVRVRLENDQHTWRETREILDLLLTPGPA